jgi:hypothetical protein
MKFSLSLITRQTRHKNYNNHMIYKSIQLDKPVCKDLYKNNSIDEEEKSVIHELNQVIAMFLTVERNQTCIRLIQSYHFAKDYDS